MIQELLRNKIKRKLTKEKDITLENRIPTPEELRKKFLDIDEIGLYLHIPFCERICSYCPYNKEIFSHEVAGRYTNAVKKEMDFYSDMIGDKSVTSFYIGGGTPTTMLYAGIEDMLVYIYEKFNMQCDIHMESHPNHLTSENLKAINDMGVKLTCPQSLCHPQS